MVLTFLSAPFFIISLFFEVQFRHTSLKIIYPLDGIINLGSSISSDSISVVIKYITAKAYVSRRPIDVSEREARKRFGLSRVDVASTPRPPPLSV